MSSGKGPTPSRGRRRARQAPQSPQETIAPDGAEAVEAPRLHTGVILLIREWVDPFVFAFLLAMFIRTFVVELFKIPSGSMTPTLVGDVVAEMHYYDPASKGGDYPDLVVANHFSGHPDHGLQGQFQIFRGVPGGYARESATPFVNQLPPAKALDFYEKKRLRYDRICVNKFSYWFRQPDRGDIVVFKVPRNIYTREKPIYVKRVAGLPNEEIAIHDNRLWADGRPVTDPPFFADQYYTNQCSNVRFESAQMGPDDFLMLGDNTLGSLDSRAWGPTPRDNLRGKAFFRYMPLGKIRFLR